MLSLFFKCDGARGAVEYAVVLSLIALLGLACLKTLGCKENHTFAGTARLLK